MCFALTSSPPQIPTAIASRVATTNERRVRMRSRDGTVFDGYYAGSAAADAAVLIAPDVRGLYLFYEELAARFASLGIPALSYDFYARTAGPAPRAADFEPRPHREALTVEMVQADLQAAVAMLRERSGAKRIFVLGFCFGGRIAFLANDLVPGLAGVIGFYGPLERLAQRLPSAHAPVLGLLADNDPGATPELVAEYDRALGAKGQPHLLHVYPGAPHSFFDRDMGDYRAESDDAWDRVLGFIRSGDPTRPLSELGRTTDAG